MKPEALARWTAVEAVLKAAGAGLRDSPRVRIAPDGRTAMLDEVQVQLHRIALGLDCVGTLATRGREAVRYAAGRWRRGLRGGALMVTAYGLVLWSMTRAPVAAVAALRETSVVFAAVIGARLMREPFGGVRMAAAAAGAAGAALLWPSLRLLKPVPWIAV